MPRCLADGSPQRAKDPIALSAKVRLILIPIGIKGFKLLWLLDTLLDDGNLPWRPRAPLGEEANNFKGARYLYL